MRLSAKVKERLRNNSARFIEQQIKEVVRTSLNNRLSFLNNYVMWDEPPVKFADGDDPIFTEYDVNPVKLDRFRPPISYSFVQS